MIRLYSCRFVEELVPNVRVDSIIDLPLTAVIRYNDTIYSTKNTQD